MNVLITGGAGYIGSHTARYLSATNPNVVVYDNLVKGHKEAVKHLNFVEGNIFDSDHLTYTIKKYAIDSVIHFAAYSLVGESMAKPDLYYHNNVSGTLSLLEVMMKNNVKKMVFSSTAAVYGEPKVVPITENAELSPTNVYGRTKLIMEQAMADYDRAYGLKYIPLRYFNACGADDAGSYGEDHQPESHLIPLILMAALNKVESIKIFGDDYPTDDGTCIRDYIHVTDLAKAHVLALQALSEGKESVAYNLGNGNGFSVKQVIAAAEAVTGKRLNQEIVARRAGDPAVLIADAGKIMQELSWKPQYTKIEEIIATAWAWHKAHPEGYSANQAGDIGV